MSLLSRSIRFVVLAVVALALAGCRDDPKPEAGPSPTPPDLGDKVKQRRAKGTGKRISPEAMKLYRLEICYFGTLGLGATRDAYLASLGEAEPGPGKIPSFGAAEPPMRNKDADDKPAGTSQPATPGAPSAQAKPSDKPGLTPGGDPDATKRPPHDRVAGRLSLSRGRLPYARHMRSCSIAKKLKQPASPELDAATERFEKYVVALHKLIGEGMRYYQRKQYEEDKFARGKELHGQLKEAFAKLDDELAAFEKAFTAWRADQKPPPDELDEGGELSEEAVAKARELVKLLWAKGDKDVEAIKKELEATVKAAEKLEAYKEKNAKSMHAKSIPPALKRYTEGAKLALEELEAGKLSSEMLLEVTYRFVALLEANHRALARMLNPKGNRPLDGMRMKRPNRSLRPPGRRLPAAPAPTGAPK